jgi:hypothetical protein
MQILSKETNVNDNADDASLLHPSLGTTQTELTNKFTEFQATISTMQDTFTKKMQSIKDSSYSKARQVESRIQEAEQKTYISEQETILKEYAALSQNYNNVLEAFSYLGCDVRKAQVKQDKRHLGMKQTIGSMMQINVGIHQNLANGTSPELLSQDQVNRLMQSTLEVDNGNGAPGNIITESS